MNQSGKNQITWPHVVSQAMPQFQRIARSHNLVAWEEESQFALQALQGNEALRKCNVSSVKNAIINIASVGLTLCPADGYAYLVPDYGECQLRISAKGLIKVATDTGQIQFVKAEVVKEADTFEYKGPCEFPNHVCDPFSDRGLAVGVYCVAKLHSGDYLIDVMPWKEVEKIKGYAKTQKIWNAWPEEMAKKAIIKRASKQWPKTDLSSRLHKTIDVMNETEGNIPDDPLKQLEETANYIIEAISKDEIDVVKEAWIELSEEEQSVLWTAKTKGGFFTQDEKKYIRTSVCVEYIEVQNSEVSEDK